MRRTWRWWAVVLAALCVTIAAAPTAGARAAAPRVGTCDSAAPWMDKTKTPDQRASALLSVLTLDQKVSLMHGVGDATGTPPVGDHTGAIPAIPSVCFPGLYLTDGPIGVRQGSEPATLMPAPVALAASWDPTTARVYGTLLGSEARAKNNDVIFGPMMNMVRIPQGGRDFETLGEDPYLASQIAVPEVQAIQARGVMADPKHYVANNQEIDRMLTNAVVDDRTLHEIYLPAFEATVKEGHAATIMAAYNKVNGAYNAQNCPLLHGVLEGQFGFDGFVLSDYDSTYGMEVPSVNCGTDLELPTGKGLAGLADGEGAPSTMGYDNLSQDVQAGTVLTSTIDAAVHRILRTVFRFGVFDRPASACPIQGDINNCSPLDPAAGEQAARQVAEAGAVLLKNSAPAPGAAPVLPLANTVTKIAVIGPNANVNAQGGGSSATVPFTNVPPLQGIKSRAGAGVTVTYDDGSNAATAATTAAAADVAIVVVADHMQEQFDRPCLGLDCDSSTPSGAQTSQDALIEAVAAANPHTVVVLNSGAPDLMPWVNMVPAILEGWYGGEENGAALAALLFGDANPSGKLPVTFPANQTDTPTQSPAQYPGVGTEARYSEGVFMGYRHYDQHNITPLFPFGYGLSYTTFGYSNIAVTPTCTTAGPGATVSFDLQNTGTRAGADVAQLYLGYPSNSAIPEPPKWLRGFQKVSLNSGQTQRVTLTLDQRAVSYWDAAAQQWKVQAGTFTAMVGGSSRDLPLTDAFAVDASCAAGTGPGAPTATPEPDSAALYISGLAALLASALWLSRRRARGALRR